MLGVLTSVVGAYYYLRIVKIMYFDEPADAFDPMPRELGAVLGLSGFAVLLFFVYPGRWSRPPTSRRSRCFSRRRPRGVVVAR